MKNSNIKLNIWYKKNGLKNLTKNSLKGERKMNKKRMSWNNFQSRINGEVLCTISIFINEFMNGTK